MTPPPPAETAPPPIATPDAERGAERVNLYVPRILQQHLVDDPETRGWTAEGTAAFVDISGFTKLSEQLARKGREGAEQITEVIGRSFESILQVAYDNGGSLLKFGGDALLLWFEGEGHVERACRATLLMRAVLDDVGRIELPDAKVTLRMSQGVHSGEFHFFAVGTSHIELLPTGPGWSRLVAMEQTASAGEILLSTETAARLPPECLGEPKGPGRCSRTHPARHRRCRSRRVRTCPPTGSRIACRRRSAARARGRRRVGTPSGHDRVPPLRRHRRADRRAGHRGRRRGAAPAGARRRGRRPRRRTSRCSPPTSTATAAS